MGVETVLRNSPGCAKLIAVDGKSKCVLLEFNQIGSRRNRGNEVFLKPVVLGWHSTDGSWKSLPPACLGSEAVHEYNPIKYW